MAQKITEAALADLHLGVASLSIKEYTPGGVTLTGMDFSAAEQLFSLETTFNLSSGTPTFSDIRVDQHRKVIDSSVETDDSWTLTGNFPSVAEALCDVAFSKVGSSVTVTGHTEGEVAGVSYSGQGYSNVSKIKEYSILVESESKNTAILFARVRVIFSKPAHDDNTTPTYVVFTGSVLPNEKSGEADWVPLKQVVSNNG